MNTFEIYEKVFDKMNELYFSNRQKYDNFGILLGQMSPHTFSNTYSADPAWFIDFSKKLQSKNKTNPIVQDGLDVIYEMVLDYNNEAYNIKDFIDDYYKLYEL